MEILIHYAGEVGIKGKNRPFFEKKLLDNIRSSIRKIGYKKLKKTYRQIIIEPNNESDIEKLTNKLKNIPGISYFCISETCDLNIEEIKENALKICKKLNPKTFCISTRRSNKNFNLNSQQINEIVGKYLIDKLNLKVDLEKHDIVIFIELLQDKVYLYTKKIQGISGLPVGVTGKLIALISGGIDSPVASFKMMTRGCSMVLLHFHNYSQHSPEVKNKILDLAKTLSKFQFKTKLYTINFKQIQQEIIKQIPSEYRMVVYRRVMLKIGEEILKKENALGFVTGDSLAQVASQTIENLSVINEATKFPIFSPLIGTDKLEIIKESKRIGTYEISVLPYEDCCSFLVAQHPATKTNLEEIKKLESKLNIKALVEIALKDLEYREFMN
ncbi:tRNA 4-thiouridine(8) synthase ThiI [Candidatus Woesearchaeota archaeon]|nr:tRNA 4-thiouridine(8) synthase ThiI [Candidatus Woesearchaeota archaeon]